MKKVTAIAPVNIALIKYWGKSNTVDITPYNSSVSMTLDNLYTKTTIEESNNGFNFYLNDIEADDIEKKKVYKFIKNFASDEEINKVVVKSTNYVSTAAGVASSSSGFSALATSCNAYFNSKFNQDELIKVTRLGSGSACRSFHGGFVAWENNNKVYRLNNSYNSFVLITVILSKTKKQISSREAMEITVKTSPNYNKFVEEGNIMFGEMVKALSCGDIKKVGELTFRSFISLHKVMEEATPKIIYLNEDSKKVLELAKKLLESGIYVYPTMDAGANVKLLSNEEDYQNIIKKLEENGYFDYYISRLGKGARIIDE